MGGTERPFGIHTIYGADGEHRTPYMTRVWIGRLRLHIFHRPDNDPDPHDHPWDFWTFPLTPYVEEVARDWSEVEIAWSDDTRYFRTLDIVPAWRLSFRPAEHTHRVVGRFIKNGLAGPAFDPSRKIITIVWRGGTRRSWGFLKNRNGQWCWIGWKDYVFGGGKHAPCEPPKGDNDA